MAKFEKSIKGDFNNIVEALNEEILNSGFSMDLVDESKFKCGETEIAVLVYDKYFMRNGNRASLTLTVAGSNGEVFVSAIGAGGGKGVIFNFSMGAESELVSIVEAAAMELSNEQ